MSAIPWYLDTASKRWLAVLAAACLVSMAVLMHSFFNALSPQDEHAVTAQPPARVETQLVRPGIEPARNSPQASGASQEDQVAPAARISPFEAQDATAQAYREEVHKQAEYLRKIMVNGKLPACFGSLTKEQVDEMQKKGITIQ